MTTPTPRVHLSEAEAAELRAELDRARADLARAQGVAVDGPESAVDGQTPATGRGMGRGANGAQNASQTVQREDHR